MANSTAENWKKRLEIRRDGQLEQYEHYDKGNKRIGVPSVLVSAIVGSTVFATVGETPQTLKYVEYVQYAAGGLSLIAAGLTSLQTFFAYDTLRAKSKVAAFGYSSLIRKLERYIELSSDSLEDDFMKEFTAEWDQVDKEAPALPKSARNLLKGLGDSST